jgi:hypothetical protein
MSPLKLGAVVVGLTTLPLIAIAMIWFTSDADPRRSVGGTRDHRLSEITKIYIAEAGGKVTPAIKSGSELAPVPFLNQELEEAGAKWRVRKVDGLTADTYDVS